LKKFKQIIVVIAITQLLLLSSCKREHCRPCNDPRNPDCSNYDPNLGIPTAEFSMRQSIKPFGWQEKEEEIAEFCDTIVACNAGVLFIAKEENALRYEWTIGDENRIFRTREVALKFDDYLKDSTNIWKPIPVKLKVIKIPEAPRNPADSIYISERTLVFANEFLWNGTFEGYFENEPNKKRVLTWDYTKNYTWTIPKEKSYIGRPYDVEGIYLFGFPQADTLKVEYLRILDRAFPNLLSYKQRKWQMNETTRIADNQVMMMSSGITYFHAYAQPSSDGKNKVRLEYRHQTERNGKETTYIFNGYKVK
jgi:hypothetical protein